MCLEGVIGLLETWYGRIGGGDGFQSGIGEAGV